MSQWQPLSDQDTARLAAQRRWVQGHFTPESQHKYEVLEEKLRLVDTILKAGWIEPSETLKLQCLGVTLGDAFVQGAGLTWVMVEDETGRDPALAVEGTSLLLFPLTMISKRIEAGEAVDVYDLYMGMCGKVRELLAETPDQSLDGARGGQ